MKFKIEATVVIKDKNGKITEIIHKVCKSYVRGMVDTLYTMMVTQNPAGQFWVGAGVGDNTFGIQVGTGSATITISDAALQTLIANGSAGGQLNYGSVSVGTVVIVGSTAKFTIARTLTNNSGADITVNEVGLKGSNNGQSNKVLFERTLLTFTVANGASGTVTYTISVTI